MRAPTMLPAEERHIESGVVTANSNGVASVTFSRPFSRTPVITANAVGTATNTVVCIKIDSANLTRSGARLVAVTYRNSGFAPISSTIHWTAVEPTA